MSDIHGDVAGGVFIHPTAVVEQGAQLGHGVRIGPFCHVTADVVLGDNVELRSHVVVCNHTELGAGSVVYPHAVVGEKPQNTAYKGEPTRLRVGKNAVIREGVTLHIGTGNARGETVVGDNCMFLAYAHIPHDAIIGNHVTFANNVLIGGHAVIGDHVIVAAGAGVHQFCEIGHHAFIGGLAAVVNDVIPYGMVLGNRAYLGGLNMVGMKRSGMARADISAMRSAYKTLFGEGDSRSLRERAEGLRAAGGHCGAVSDVVDFILRDSKRHFITPSTARRSRDADDE